MDSAGISGDAGRSGDVRVSGVGPARPPTRVALREAFDTLAHLLGLSDARTDRATGLVTVRLGMPGDAALTLIDRRTEATRSHRLDATAEDFVERLTAIRAGQTGLRAKILVDPALCFSRTIDLPSAALPRMRAVLAQELEVATPFQAEAVHSDWYVEGEDAETRRLRVRHVVLKRTRLDPLLSALDRAGIAAGPVTVGPDEDRTMPIDLLSGGHRALQGLFGGVRAGDVALLAGAGLLLLSAFWGGRQHQAATLDALDDAFVAARRAAAPAVPPRVLAGLAAIGAGRAPRVAQSWDALAAAFPDTASALSVHLDADGARLTLSAADEAAAVGALGHVPGFGAPLVRDVPAGPNGTRRVVLLPRTDREAPPR